MKSEIYAISLIEDLIDAAEVATDDYDADSGDKWKSSEFSSAIEGGIEAHDKFVALVEAGERIGSWLSAALDDPSSCAEFKSDIEAWLSAYHAVQGRVLALGRRREGE